MKSSSEWIEEIENKIVELKGKNINTYYNIMAKMTRQTANEIALHFAGNEEYSTEFKRCFRCDNKFDIIITWSN